MLFLPQIPSPSLQLFPHLQCRHLLDSLIVGRVDGGDTLDVEGGVLAAEVLPGDGPVEAERVGLDHLAAPHHARLDGVGHCLKAGHLVDYILCFKHDILLERENTPEDQYSQNCDHLTWPNLLWPLKNQIDILL